MTRRLPLPDPVYGWNQDQGWVLESRRTRLTYIRPYIRTLTSPLPPEVPLPSYKITLLIVYTSDF